MHFMTTFVCGAGRNASHQYIAFYFTINVTYAYHMHYANNIDIFLHATAMATSLY